MQHLIAAGRLARLGLHLLRGVLIVRLCFHRWSGAERQQAVTRWSRQLLEIAAIELVVQGRAVEHGPLLIVANHVSWLDIPVLQACCRLRLVSKADLQRWPVVGMLARAVGTLFIERERRRDAMRVVHHMADALRAGDIIGVFPEGTTSDGSVVLPFHANLLQSALAADAPVQTVSLRFLGADGHFTRVPAFAGEDLLVHSVWRTLAARGVRVVVTFGPPQAVTGRDRRTLAQQLRRDIEQQLLAGAPAAPA